MATVAAECPEPDVPAASGWRLESARVMSAQGDCEFLVQRARELVPQDLWAAKAWLITARSLYPADFNIQVRSRQCMRPPCGEVRAPAARVQSCACLGASASCPAPSFLPSHSLFSPLPSYALLLHLSPALLLHLPGALSPPLERRPTPLEVGCAWVPGALLAIWPRQHMIATSKKPFARSFIIMAAVCSVPTTLETLFHLILGA